MEPRVRRQIELAEQIRLEVAGYLESPAPYEGELRRHPCWELMYVARGQGEVENGIRTHPFAPATLLLVQPEQAHRIRAPGPDPLHMLYIRFSLDPTTAGALVRDIPLELYQGSPKHVVKEMLKRVVREADRGRMHSPRSTSTILYVLAMILHTMAGERPQDRLHWAVVEKARSYLEDNADRPVSVRDLAEHVHLSEHYCADLFREVVGVSPKRYHHSLRMGLAAEMLTDVSRAMNVTEIADRLGFSSVHYFSRRFSEHFGLCPTRYRRGGAA